MHASLNIIFTLISKLVGSVVPILFQDQLEADDNLSLKQRLALAGGSAVEGVGDVTGVEAVNIAGKVLTFTL